MDKTRDLFSYSLVTTSLHCFTAWQSFLLSPLSFAICIGAITHPRPSPHDPGIPALGSEGAQVSLNLTSGTTSGSAVGKGSIRVGYLLSTLMEYWTKAP